MGIIKLQNEGETLTMTVAGCEAVAGQYGEQVKFTAVEGDVLYLPKSSADNQLERIGLTYAECIGNRLTFSRDPNKKPGAKPYWGINVAPPAQPESRRIPPPSGAPPQGVSRGSLPFDDDPGPQDPDEPLYREPAPTPRETREKVAGVSERETAYLACFDRVVAHVTRIAKAHGLPVDASACQAITFSIMGNAGR